MTYRRIVVTKHSALGENAESPHFNKDKLKHQLRQIIHDRAKKETADVFSNTSSVETTLTSKSLNDVRKRDGNRAEHESRRRSNAALPDSLRAANVETGAMVSSTIRASAKTRAGASGNGAPDTSIATRSKEARAVTASDGNGKEKVKARAKVRKAPRRRKSKTRNRRRNGGISVTIPSLKNRARTRRRHTRIQNQIGTMSYDALHNFLSEKGLIKPSSTAPDAVLRQIARGMFFN